jgi:hypothetical protein
MGHSEVGLWDQYELGLWDQYELGLCLSFYDPIIQAYIVSRRLFISIRKAKFIDQIINKCSCIYPIASVHIDHENYV